jgi:hypothetical protein
MRCAAVFVLLAYRGLVCGQTWQLLPGGTTESLRGVSSVNERVVWASGTHGTVIRSTDGGVTWRRCTLPQEAGGLDFRGIVASSARQAMVVSSGEGGQSRVYETGDGGRTWILRLTNPDAPAGFFDALALGQGKRWFVLGDPVGASFVVLLNGARLKTPPPVPGEGAFAASNSALAVGRSGEVWFATGGAGGARVFHSADGGRTWSVAATPVRNDSASAGIFSIAFDGRRGVAVGGDYRLPKDSTGNVAVSTDGGRTWSAPQGPPPGGYRSSVVFLKRRNAWIATGTSGSDIASGDGHAWRTFDSAAFNALGATPDGQTMWAVGPSGRVARLYFKQERYTQKSKAANAGTAARYSPPDHRR